MISPLSVYHLSLRSASHLSVDAIISSHVTVRCWYAAMRPRIPVRLLSTAIAELFMGLPSRMLSMKFTTLVTQPPLKVSSFSAPVHA